MKRVRSAAIFASLMSVVLAFMISGSAMAATRQAAGGPIIGQVPVFDAPVGGKGGIQNTFVRCRNYRVEPRAVMHIRNADTGWERTFRWTGALPGLFFPRVRTGTYEVATSAWCSGTKKTRKQSVTIEEKTYESTVSRAEFDAVELGMSFNEVTAIIGFEGRDPGTYSGETSYTYDNMSFWDWSIITFRNDRVIRKHWKVGHD